MRQYRVTFDKIVPDDSGHDHTVQQHTVVVSACSDLSAAHAAKTLFCEAAGIVDWRQRADTWMVAELAAARSDHVAEAVCRRHDLTDPVHWQGRQWAVTGYGIEALDGLYHVPFSEIPDAGRPDWLESLWHRYGTDRDDLAAALQVARSIRSAATPEPSRSAA